MIATTAEWAANDIVIGAGEIVVERVSASEDRLKVGDGVSVFSALPYASASSNTINAPTQAALDAKVAKTGDTMTGPLILSADAVAALGAATLQQMQAADAALQASINTKLSLTGGTLTGYLTLNADPTSPLHPVTKAYADAIGDGRVELAGDTMTGPLILYGDPQGPLEAATRSFVENGSYTTVVGGSSAYAGKVVKLGAGGMLDASILPVAANYLGTVDLTQNYTLSGTYSPGDYFAASTSGAIDASWNVRLNGSPTTVGAGQFIYWNANGRWDLVGDTSSSAAIAGKVDKAGDIMTGPLTLSGAPTAALHAATKAYADLMVPLAGAVMTGLLTLSGPPTAPLHAATKAYADTMLPLTGGTMIGPITLQANPVQPLEPATKAYADLMVPLAGGTMTGLLTLSGPPTAALHAATKAYVDTASAGGLLKAQNLADLANIPTARSNLGLGALATLSVVDTAQIADNSVNGAKIALGSDAAGDIMYHNGIDYVRLPAGAASTPGSVLKTNGAAPPSWLLLGTAATRNISVGTTAPASPATNDLWVDTN